VTCANNTPPAYDQWALSGNYQFADKYNVQLGIENLLDEDPPCVGAEPTRAPYAFTCEHASQVGGDQYNATFDPLGRRYYLSMTMDF
jgi:outer membrane receptor protein involved in Fe transport